MELRSIYERSLDERRSNRLQPALAARGRSQEIAVRGVE
jgi:hypothetical protein